METPKYLTIVQTIKDNIERQEYTPGERIHSEMELCAIHKVSRQTIRQALNVLEQEGVLSRKQGSGTFVSKTPGTIKNNNLRTVGVISTYFSDYIFPEIITGIEQVLSEHNVGMQLALTHNQVKNEEKALLAMLDQNISALIVEPSKSALPNPNMRLYAEIEERGIPLIFFNARYSWSGFPCIALDDVQAGCTAANCLIDAKHQKIAGLFQMDDIQGHLRYKGFMQSLRIAGIEVDEKKILWYAAEDIDDLFLSPARLLSRLRGCDAVVCYNDQLALRLMDFCKKQKIAVPEELSVVGIDNANPAALCEVPLTTVAHPKKKLGRDVANAILKLLDNPCAAVECFYQPELIWRSSVITCTKNS